MNSMINVPSVSVACQGSGRSITSDELGMRAMQARAYAKRGEQYLLIKSPPASGKSRALMFIALDKIHNQGVQQALVVVPERSIGASFNNEPLSKFGFWSDWEVEPHNNLCNSPGTENSKVKSVGAFLSSDAKFLICTHATFRFAFKELGVEAFDNRLIAIDEFHHVSANDDAILGTQLKELIVRDKAHVVAMTGSYFRGDAEPILLPEDEEKFETVTYTYYEQLNGYEHLKELDLGYYFYTGPYSEEVMSVLDPNEKTIIHIPNVNARESTKDKYEEVNRILEELGEWVGADPETGFQLIKREGKTLRVADLVDDDPNTRDRVSAALKDPAQKDNRDHVDIIIALGMAKEGFDWIWCEHALTIGYRSSLTEIVQIIGRATRDAPGKQRARFTNLIAEPDADESTVAEAVNDTLKAIAASLLMEQVLAPKFEFKLKTPTNKPDDGFDYGPNGYQQDGTNVGFNAETGTVQVEIAGLKQPESAEAKRIVNEDIKELLAAFAQDKTALERGMFDEEVVPEELTQVRMAAVVAAKHPNLSEDDQEAVRQHAIAAMNIVQGGKSKAIDDEESPNTALLDGIRRFAMDVRELDIDLIDNINPFGTAYSILSKTMSEDSLKEIAAIIGSKKVAMTHDEARELAKRAIKFKNENGRLPSITAADPWERRMAEGIDYLKRKAAEASDD